MNLTETIIKLADYNDKCAPRQWQPHRRTAINRLYYVNGGTAWYIDTQGKHLFKKGHLYLLPSNANFILEQDPADPIDHLYFDFAITPPIANGMVYEWDCQDPVLLHTVQVLKQLVKTKASFSAVKDLFCWFLEYIFVKHRIDRVSDPAIGKAVLFILENYRNPIAVADIAAAVNLNPNYFIRLFKSKIGVSPYHFVREMRISKAVSLLRYGRTLQQAAAYVGFENASSLCHAMRNSRFKEGVE